jgi:hypothetical protein
MTDSPQDDARLRATEAQMRHALGLHGNTPSRSKAEHPMTSANGSQPQRRRFVRDGEVPVTVIRRDHQPGAEHGINQLDAARQAVRSEAMARERAERSLEEAQITIRDLQTKLAHERLARNEALEAARRAETGEQAVQQTLLTVQAELVAERLAHRNTNDALAEAQEGRLEAEGRLRQAIDDQQAQQPTQAPHGLLNLTKSRRKASAGRNTDSERHATGTTRPRAPAQKKTNEPAMVDGGARATKARRRGRPAKAGEQESKIVEWWKPRKTATGGASTIGTLGKRGRGRPKGSKNRPKP